MTFSRTFSCKMLASACAAAAVAVWLLPAPYAAAQRQRSQQQRSQQSSSSHSVTIPSEGMIQLEVDAPQEARVGESFDYTIMVTNPSDNIVLHDVKIEQRQAQGFEVESATIQSQSDQQQNRRQASQQRQKQQGQKQKQQSSSSWTIKTLKPGETRRIEVQATSDEEGQGEICLAVTSYTPSLCVTTRFVKPELTLVKEGPDQVALCDAIEWSYYVKNEGSADPGEFVIRDPLPEGLVTINGEKELSFEVDGIEPGETRKFVADLRAEKTGEFSSRAVAVLDQDQKTRSNKITTAVEEAQLDVAISGPQTQYIGRVLDYTVRVTNNGKVPAPDAELALHWPDAVTLLQISDPQESNQAVQAKSGSQSDRQTRASGQSQQQRQQRRGQQGQQRQRGQQQLPEQETLSLGTLDPGQTVEVRFATRSDQPEALTFRAVAEYVCGSGDHRQTFTARAMTKTDLVAVPALAIAVTDSQDPVPVGDELIYTIIVKNEGQAPDDNIQVGAKLPQSLEFVEATGASNAKSDGQNVSFETIETLDPGDEVSWEVRVRAKDPGSSALNAQLSSKMLKKEANVEEPTRIFDTSRSSNQQQSDQRNKKKKKAQN